MEKIMIPRIKPISGSGNNTDSYELQVAEIKDGILVENWEISEDTKYYYYLKEEDLYNEMISSMFDSLDVVCKNVFKEYKSIEEKKNEKKKPKPNQLASMINDVEKKLTKVKSNITLSIAYMDNNIYVIDDKEKDKPFNTARNYLVIYDKTVDTYLNEIAVLSRIEIGKNEYHLNEIIEMFSAITIIGLIPTIIFAFYGANFSDEFSIPFVAGVALIISGIAIILTWYKEYLIPLKIKDDPKEKDKIWVSLVIVLVAIGMIIGGFCWIIGII